MSQPTASGYAPVNGVQLYWESYGPGGTPGGTPLVVVHGGFGLISMGSALIDELAGSRRVVAIELQGHGHTADIDRPFTYEAFADDIAALIGYLDMGPCDLLGYSLGGSACLRTALRHPGSVRKLGVVSAPFRRNGWFPEVLTGFDHMGRAAFEQMKLSPMYQAWLQVAPDQMSFPMLMDKTGDLQRRPYDWGDEVKGLEAQTLLVYADADSIPVSHVAEFYALLGGGLSDAGWDGINRPEARLAVLPGLTHYDVFYSPIMAQVAKEFFV